MNNDTGSYDADFRRTKDLTVCNICSADCTNVGYLEDLSDLNMSENNFFIRRFEQAFHCSLYIFNRIINNTVKLDINACQLSLFCNTDTGAYVKSNDNCIGNIRKNYICL